MMSRANGAAKSPCLVCQAGRNARVIFRLPSCTVVRCALCGFVYLDGERVPSDERARYEYDHFRGYVCLAGFEVEEIAREQVESVRSILRRAGSALEEMEPGLPVLDVGCARGHFLRRFVQETGRRNVTGIDTSPIMTAWGRVSFGLDLRVGAIEGVDLPAGSFALISMLDVLEHVANPRQVLARILSLLRPGGWAVLEVPSEATAFRAMAKLGYRLSAGRLVTPLRTIYHSRHLSYFTRGSLRKLAEDLGAEAVTIVTKEAHITRFGAGRYALPARIAIRAVSRLDKILGTQAKLLCALRRPSPENTG